MKPETIDTITRHLKGIVAALEKEKVKPEVEGFEFIDVGGEQMTVRKSLPGKAGRMFNQK